MTKTHKRILILYIFIIGIGIISPFLLSWEDKLKWSLDIAKTISILSASILALFYFDPFGIRKSNLSKQHENVIQVLEKIFAQRIMVDTELTNSKNSSKMLSSHLMTMRHLEFVLSDDFSSEYLESPVLINIKNFFEETKELVELKNSIFTPKSVSEKMFFLEFNSASRTTEDNESFSIVRWGSSYKKDKGDLYDQINNEKLVLKVLFQNYLNLINECVYWLEINSFSIKRLNIK